MTLTLRVWDVWDFEYGCIIIIESEERISQDSWRILKSTLKNRNLFFIEWYQ